MKRHKAACYRFDAHCQYDDEAIIDDNSFCCNSVFSVTLTFARNLCKK